MVGRQSVAWVAGGLAVTLVVAAAGGALVALIGEALLDRSGLGAFVGSWAAIYDPLLVVPLSVGPGVAVAIAGVPGARWKTFAAGVTAAAAFWLVAARVSVTAGAIALEVSGRGASATYYHYYHHVLLAKWVVWSILETVLLVALVLGARFVADRFTQRATLAALAASVLVMLLIGLVYAAIALHTDHAFRRQLGI